MTHASRSLPPPVRVGALLAALAGPFAVHAQSPTAPAQPPESNPATLSYEREWFRYLHDGRRDPFLPTAELGDPSENASAPSPPARLLGIIHHPERSDLGIALLAGPEAMARPEGMAATRLRIGQSQGGVRLARILADQVVVEAVGPEGPLRRAIRLPERSRQGRPR